MRLRFTARIWLGRGGRGKARTPRGRILSSGGSSASSGLSGLRRLPCSEHPSSYTVFECLPYTKTQSHVSFGFHFTLISNLYAKSKMNFGVVFKSCFALY